MTSTERVRSLEKSLGRDGEKLSRISGTVGIEQRRNSRLISGPQQREFGSHHLVPRQLLLARRQGRCAILGVILEVKLVGELMQDDVFAIRGISCAGFGRIPRDYQGSQLAASLAQASHSPFFPHGTFKMPFLIHHVCRWVNKNCKQAREVVGFAVQEEKASLRCDSHADLMSELKATTTFKTFFGEKHLDVA